METSSEKKIEIWGGLECTLNRVNKNYYDQLDFSGHYNRPEDLELIAGLGIKKLRYPILWEKHKPEIDTEINWAFTETRLNILRRLNIEPIAGLVHHGSGPEYATIETDQFATGLAAYAAQVAKKFPLINYYTPVNEPLTTARFCALYGVWYPHHKNTLSFFRLLINQCKAIVLAMKAIREINPNAKLLQTEDLAKTYSTEILKPQAFFENRRRWLSFDLISGKVASGHLLWDYLMELGIEIKDLDFFQENSCPPDILGFNYYLTSERYLDERIANFPAHTIGGNNQYFYADVEAVRVNINEETGLELLLTEAWERFKTPMAITEVHLGCSREEQLRWFNETWLIAGKLRRNNIDLKAITAWSLFGSYGWNHLLAHLPGRYEPGAFDIRSGALRPTALAKEISSCAGSTSFQHPVMEEKGWWQRDIRILYPVFKSAKKASEENKTSQPLIIIGKNGTLGKAFSRLCELRGIHHYLLGRDEMDISKFNEAEQIILKKKPWAIVNAAGFVKVDEAETDVLNCFLANTQGPVNLANLCEKHQVKFLTFSSDLVFNGKKNTSYLESDFACPLNVYGESKALAEKLVLKNNPSALIIRTSAFFGPWDQANFIYHLFSALKNGKAFTAVHDIYISPTYIPDLVNASLDILIDSEQGIWHLANEGEISWAEFARELATRKGFNKNLIREVSAPNFGYIAQRPTYSVLKSERGSLLPSLSDAIDQYLNECQVE